MTYPRRMQVPQQLILPTDRVLTSPLPEDPAELVEVERLAPPPGTPEEPAAPAPAVDPDEYAAVRDLALALADLQPSPGKSAPTAPVKDAAARIRGQKP